MAILESKEISQALDAVLSGDQNAQYLLDVTYPGWGFNWAKGTAQLDVPDFFVKETWFVEYKEGIEIYNVPLVGRLDTYEIKRRGWRFS